MRILARLISPCTDIWPRNRCRIKYRHRRSCSITVIYLQMRYTCAPSNLWASSERRSGVTHTLALNNRLTQVHFPQMQHKGNKQAYMRNQSARSKQQRVANHVSAFLSNHLPLAKSLQKLRVPRPSQYTATIRKHLRRPALLNAC